MPMSFIQPALLLALPIQLHWSRWNASYWDSLVLMAPSFMAFRVALIICMHFLLRNIKQVRISASAAAFLHHLSSSTKPDPLPLLCTQPGSQLVPARCQCAHFCP